LSVKDKDKELAVIDKDKDSSPKDQEKDQDLAVNDKDKDSSVKDQDQNEDLAVTSKDKDSSVNKDNDWSVKYTDQDRTWLSTKRTRIRVSRTRTGIRT